MERFTFRLVKSLNVEKSLSKLGNVMWFREKQKNISAKAASLIVVWDIETPFISGSVLRLHSRGSRVRVKIKGERGQPCRVPFDNEKEFNRWPLTRTLAVGEE